MKDRKRKKKQMNKIYIDNSCKKEQDASKPTNE